MEDKTPNGRCHFLGGVGLPESKVHVLYLGLAHQQSQLFDDVVL